MRPFRGLRYDTERVDLSNVIVPPYDVIAADEREAFFARDPHNAIRFELTRKVDEEASTDYTDVSETLAAWIRSGVLVRDDEPALYVLRQRFKAPSGELLERIGFFAELALEDYSARVVLPHERTLAGPKADRLKLLRATRANLSSVFLLYEDREQSLARVLESALDPERGAPLGVARDDAGVEYALAALRDPEPLAAVQRFLSDRSTVIADGHHRYETALAYRDERRRATATVDPAAAWESTLAYFANAYAPGSLLLPIHRVIRTAPAPTAAQWQERLPGWQQEIVEIAAASRPIDVARCIESKLAALADRPAFAADDGTGTLRIFWRREPLAETLVVRTLEREVIGSVFGLDEDAIRNGAVSFWKSAERAAGAVRGDAEPGTVALFVNPLSPDDVFRVTGAGEVMPQKSTFFYPKIPTGLVFRTHSADG